jgi:hypothetical protein
MVSVDVQLRVDEAPDAAVSRRRCCPRARLGARGTGCVRPRLNDTRARSDTSALRLGWGRDDLLIVDCGLCVVCLPRWGAPRFRSRRPRTTAWPGGMGGEVARWAAIAAAVATALLTGVPPIAAHEAGDQWRRGRERPVDPPSPRERRPASKRRHAITVGHESQYHCHGSAPYRARRRRRRRGPLAPVLVQDRFAAGADPHRSPVLEFVIMRTQQRMQRSAAGWGNLVDTAQWHPISTNPGIEFARRERTSGWPEHGPSS